MTEFTPNFGWRIPNFDEVPWHGDVNAFMAGVDAALGTVMGLSGASTWASGVDYAENDVVKSGARFYIATADHTSGAATQPGVGADWATVWTLVASTTATGDVTGPDGGVVGGICVVWDGTSGKLIKTGSFAPFAGTWDALTGKPTSFNPVAHTHPMNSIIGLLNTIQGLEDQILDIPSLRHALLGGL